MAAFSGTVVAPASLKAVSPDLSTPFNIPAASDFKLGWTGAGSGTVTLNLFASSGAAEDGVIVCTAPSSGGSMTVPGTLLANLKSGDSASLELSVSNNSPLSVANANVELTAEIIVTGSATIQ